MKTIRIALLLVLLVFVALQAWLLKIQSTDWKDTLWVAIYPIAGETSQQVDAYIDQLDSQSFESIADFFSEEMAAFGVGIERPFRFELGNRITETPPDPPSRSETLQIMWWSLKMRYWAFVNDETDFAPHIRIFVVYHEARDGRMLDHSVGIEKGLLGIVNAFASQRMQGQNHVVIAHEVLHTLGASDKYQVDSTQPSFPEGYADPAQEPLYPQEFAELMAARIPLSESSSRIPANLGEVVIGRHTAGEINWIAD